MQGQNTQANDQRPQRGPTSRNKANAYALPSPRENRIHNRMNWNGVAKSNQDNANALASPGNCMEVLLDLGHQLNIHLMIVPYFRRNRRESLVAMPFSCLPSVDVINLVNLSEQVHIRLQEQR